MDIAEVLQRLHDNETNGTLSWFYNGVYQWKLGSEPEWKAEGTSATLADAVRELAEAAAAEFPETPFAAWWKGQRAARH